MVKKEIQGSESTEQMILKELEIWNFAIIDHLKVSFQSGLTAITGETGAGKSIIIGALNLALGEKANLSMIGTNSHSAEIICELETEGYSDELKQYFIDNSLEIIPNKLVLKRVLYNTGRSKAWINGQPSPINILKSLGEKIIDLHGQHDHQSLLNEDIHIDILDKFGDYQGLLSKVQVSWNRLDQLQNSVKLLKQKQKINREKRELWQFQYDEIAKVEPKEDEYQELLEEQKILENAEKIHQLAGNLSRQLYEDDQSFYNNIQEVIQNTEILNKITSGFSEYVERLNETRYLFHELSNDLTRYSDKVQFDPQRLEETNSRIYTFQQLMKKYGNSMSEVIAYQHKIEKYLDDDDSLDNQITDAEKRADSERNQFSRFCLELSEKRCKSAGKIEKSIESKLDRLGIKNSRFEVDIKQAESVRGTVNFDGKLYEATEKGMDFIRFNIRTNPGQPLLPLADIVSGGEVSRIMLALKSILAEKDGVPVLIFDEIDTGISGPIARIVGEEIKILAQNHQILCITHLPQIASLGDDHLSVRKVSDDTKSQTLMVRLTRDQRIREVASLLGGKKITETSLKQAEELLTVE